MKELLTFLDEKYSNRNFALGTIYISEQCHPDRILDGLPSPKDQCVRYFRFYHRKIACFRDIQLFVSRLSKEDQESFLTEISDGLDKEEVDSIYRGTESSLQFIKLKRKSAFSNLIICCDSGVWRRIFLVVGISTYREQNCQSRTTMAITASAMMRFC